MFPTAPGGASFTVTLANEEATQRFAADIAAALDPGDLVTLSGDLGAGKTTFARALIRHLAGDATIEVPSPTFTLLPSYEPLALCAGPRRFLPALGRGRAGGTWIRRPARRRRGAGGMARSRRRFAAARPPRHYLTLAPQLGAEVRAARVVSYGAFAARAERIPQLRAFLDASGSARRGAGTWSAIPPPASSSASSSAIRRRC